MDPVLLGTEKPLSHRRSDTRVEEFKILNKLLTVRHSQ